MSETEPLSETVPEGAPKESGFLLRDAFWLLVVYFGTQFVIVAVYAFVDVIRHGKSDLTSALSSDFLNRLMVIAFVVTVFATLLMLRRVAFKRGASFAEFGLVWPGFAWLWNAFLLFIGMRIVVGGLTVMFGGEVMRQSMKTMNGMSSGDPRWNLASALLVVLILPVLEELIFRVVLFRALSRHMSQMVAVVLAVSVFAALHLQYVLAGGAVAFLMTAEVTLLGAALMWLYLKSGSILPSIVFHIANNALAFAGLMILK